MTPVEGLSAFKDCDIRGRYPDEVNELLFRRVGDAFGRRVLGTAPPGSPPPTLVVGCDARPSTPALKKSFLDGVTSYGLQVVDLGIVPTPVVYWAKEQLRAHACAVITASHNPPEFNGLKVMNGDRPPTPEMIKTLAAVSEPGGKPPPGQTSTVQVRHDLLQAYEKQIIDSFSGLSIESLSIALDPGNGCQSGVATKVLRALGAEVTALHDRLDGTFPERHPDCAVPEHLGALSTSILESGADLGVAFDGDGDRIAVVDDKGRMVGAERLGMILLKGPLTPGSKAPVIIDLKCSMHLDRLVEQAGGVAVRCKSGHAYMKEAVLLRGALMGVELSGHVFLGMLHGRDDPLFTSLVLAGYLAKTRQPLSRLSDGLPKMYMTQDIRIPMADREIDRVLDRLASGLNGSRVETLDGVRLVWEKGWLLARRSITEPKITMRLEGESLEDLKWIGGLFGDAFPELAHPVEKAIGQVTP
jgi:phosphomannomutase/phosphoglucomutase